MDNGMLVIKGTVRRLDNVVLFPEIFLLFEPGSKSCSIGCYADAEIINMLKEFGITNTDGLDTMTLHKAALNHHINMGFTIGEITTRGDEYKYRLLSHLSH